MSRTRGWIGRAGWLAPALALPLLAGCAAGGGSTGGEARAHEQTVAACRDRAEQAYEITHRGDIYSMPSQVNTPFSADYQPGVPSRGLSALYEHDQMVNDCVRNTGAEGSRTPQLPAVPPPHS